MGSCSAQRMPWGLEVHASQGREPCPLDTGERRQLSLEKRGACRGFWDQLGGRRTGQGAPLQASLSVPNCLPWLCAQTLAKASSTT